MSIAAERATFSDLFRKLTFAWRTRDLAGLELIFHRDMVIGAQGQTMTLIEGRDACIETYRDFAERAIIETYTEDPAWIGVWTDTAIASYAWDMTWTDEEGFHAASGQDVLTLAKEEGAWRVVGRMLLETARH
jgi:hypothetical protein